MLRRRGATTPKDNPKRGKHKHTPGSEEVSGDESNTCPICFEQIDSGGSERTIIYPFECSGVSVHGICTICDKRMFETHGDACPICRAPRSQCSIESLGLRPTVPRTRDSLVGTIIIGRGTMFFPVDNDVTDESPTIVIRNVTRDGAARQEASTDLAGAINEILRDPVFTTAVDGLRRPSSIPLSSFLNMVDVARQRQNGGTQRHENSGT